MIIGVTEVYNGEKPITWACDTEKLDVSIPHCKKFKASVESLGQNEFATIAYDGGFQDDDIFASEVELPAIIEKFVLLIVE
jgi:hypothetical protein